MFKFFAKTIHGKNKIKNDDCFLINSIVSQDDELKKQSKNENFIAAIADGVGSSEYGHLASKYFFENLSQHSNILSHQIILNIIKKVNVELLNKYNGNGTAVFSIVYANDDKITIYHAGDTRVYKITTSDNLVQLTNDHTYTQKLIDDGIITESMRNSHYQKNIIFKSLGAKPYIYFDIYKNSFEKGEKLLLTSDGIHDYIDYNSMKNILLKSKSSKNSIEKLIELSKQNNSKDDLTAILIEYI